MMFVAIRKLSWRRMRAFVRQLRGKLAREPLSPARVAAGWAIGMFVGCTIPFGCQLIVAVPVAMRTRTSAVGAATATFITNPFTIIFIYPAQIWAGCRLIGCPLAWSELAECARTLASVSIFTADGWRALGQVGWQMLGGFFAGGFLLALVCTPPTYFAVLRAVRAIRRRRAAHAASGEVA